MILSRGFPRRPCGCTTCAIVDMRPPIYTEGLWHFSRPMFYETLHDAVLRGMSASTGTMCVCVCIWIKKKGDIAANLPPVITGCRKYCAKSFAIRTSSGIIPNHTTPAVRNSRRNCAKSPTPSLPIVRVHRTANSTLSPTRDHIRIIPGVCSWSWNLSKSS